MWRHWERWLRQRGPRGMSFISLRIYIFADISFVVIVCKLPTQLYSEVVAKGVSGKRWQGRQCKRSRTQRRKWCTSTTGSALRIVDNRQQEDGQNARQLSVSASYNSTWMGGRLNVAYRCYMKPDWACWQFRINKFFLQIYNFTQY